MPKNSGEGTKIAQAAKELNVTSVTIRRYLTEFNIETMSDENGIKVLPQQAMEELFEIRRLKDEGLTNPKVLEFLEERRSKPQDEKKEKAEPARRTARKAEPAAKTARRVTRVQEAEESEEPSDESSGEPAEEAAEPVEQVKPARRARGQSTRRENTEAESQESEAEESSDDSSDSEGGEGADSDGDGEGRVKHSLTCQTCNKVFEHMNPRLRDCLDCYRVKRKERRRGGDKHKNVIQNPLAQQVVSKNQQAQQQTAPSSSNQNQHQHQIEQAPARIEVSRPVREPLSFAPAGTTVPRPPVRSYRKAIEETRQITSNLKRRLERPDLPEADRRFLEQIYAYQLILHQGWKHLAEYRSGGVSQDRND